MDAGTLKQGLSFFFAFGARVTCLSEEDLADARRLANSERILRARPTYRWPPRASFVHKDEDAYALAGPQGAVCCGIRAVRGSSVVRVHGFTARA